MSKEKEKGSKKGEKDELPPHIRRYMLELKKDIGKDVIISAFKKTKKSYKHFNKLNVNIPFCSVSVNWELTFSLEHPNRLPNIFIPNFHPNISRLKSFKFFDWTKPESFSACISDLLNEFKASQEIRFQTAKNATVSFEYETVRNIKGNEYYLSPDESTAIFKIPLIYKEINDFVAHYRKKPSSKNKSEMKKSVTAKKLTAKKRHVFLLAEYVNTNVPKTSMSFSSEIDVPSYIRKMKMPVWNGGQTCLVEYLATVQSKFKSIVGNMMFKVQRRKEFVKKFIELLKNPLELDTVNYKKVSFLCEYQAFKFFLFISLDDDFPLTKPLLQLQSVQLIQSMKDDGTIFPLRAKMTSFDWGEVMDTDKIVREIIKRLISVSKEFADICDDYRRKQ